MVVDRNVSKDIFENVDEIQKVEVELDEDECKQDMESQFICRFSTF